MSSMYYLFYFKTWDYTKNNDWKKERKKEKNFSSFELKLNNSNWYFFLFEYVLNYDIVWSFFKYNYIYLKYSQGNFSYLLTFGIKI